MQILHRTFASIQQYVQDIRSRAAANLYRPQSCPMCGARHPLRAHGFYYRTLVAVKWDELIPVRRYLCLVCRHTLSLLPQFVLPYLRFGIAIVRRFLVARLLKGWSMRKAGCAAFQPRMPYQRGQAWVRRFRARAEALCLALAQARSTAVPPAPDWVTRALRMLEATGWIPAHCCLFARVRMHMLGWPRFLAPYGWRVKLAAPTRDP
jgi:Domain of unknown function (DUF6431)